jgi:hypothetical protein
MEQAAKHDAGMQKATSGKSWKVSGGNTGQQSNEITTGMKVTLGETAKTPARNEQASDGAAAPSPPTVQDGQRRSSGGARRGFGGN